jgi:hypothetical protein
LGRVLSVPPPSALVLDQIDGGQSKRQCALWLDRERIDPVDKKVPCFESLPSCLCVRPRTLTINNGFNPMEPYRFWTCTNICK